jgi:hypothetical protein
LISGWKNRFKNLFWPGINTIEKEEMRKNKIRIFLIGCFLVIPFFINEALAQPPPPGPGGDAVPIQGLGILAALGIAYGVKKLRNKKK